MEGGLSLSNKIRITVSYVGPRKDAGVLAHSGDWVYIKVLSN